MQIPESSLLPQDEESTDGDVDSDGDRARPPDDGITYEVDLTVVFDPEVLDGQPASLNMGDFMSLRYHA